MEGHVFCALTEHLETSEISRSNLARWWVRDSLPNVDRDKVRKTLADVMAGWASVANVSAVEASSEAKADLVLSVVPPPGIDGPMGILADCMLPGPPVQSLRVDGADQWAIVLGNHPQIQNVLDLRRVLFHETGHFWGVGHDRRGAKSLMAPTFSWEVDSPQSWDVEQMVKLYGPPVSVPPPGSVSTYIAVLDQDRKVMRTYKLTEVEDLVEPLTP